MPNVVQPSYVTSDSSLHMKVPNVLIIKETCDISGPKCYGVPVAFHECLTAASGNKLTLLDRSNQHYVTRLCVIYPSKVQFYCDAHLECNPHYTVADGWELFDLVRSASHKRICVHIYCSKRNYCDGNVI